MAHLGGNCDCKLKQLRLVDCMVIFIALNEYISFYSARGKSFVGDLSHWAK